MVREWVIGISIFIGCDAQRIVLGRVIGEGVGERGGGGRGKCGLYKPEWFEIQL